MNEVYRQEKKYFMNLLDMAQLSARLDQVMLRDAHSGAQGYAIRSLYFDSLDERDYQEKVDGIELRRKLRLRIYDPAADFAMLEMKQKEGIYQKKRSLRIARADAEALARGCYDSLLSYPDPFAAECYGLMTMWCYRPKTIVEYRRLAYIARENKIRITFDRDIRAAVGGWDLFDQHLPTLPVLDPGTLVMEVKFTEFLPQTLRELLPPKAQEWTAVSKYVLCCDKTAYCHGSSGWQG